MAHAAALSVAESPLSSEYNPLYIYGGSGLGKTHLIHSIAHYVMEHSPNLKVLYITSEDYISEIVEAMRKSKQDRTTLNNIKRKYREVDILMIDDVQKRTTRQRYRLLLCLAHTHTDRNDPVRSAGGYIFRGNLFIFTFPVEGIGPR